MKILNFGSLNVDYIYEVDHFVTAGETLSSNKLTVEAGGKGLNQSLALSKSTAHLYHAGMIGQTERDLFMPLLEKNGVDTQFVKLIESQSGHAIIQLDQTGQNGILLYGGANLCLTEAFVDEVLSHFEKGDILLLQNEIACMPYIMNQSIAMGMRVFLNPSPITPALFDYPMDKVDTLIFNEVEGEQLSGCVVPQAMIQALKQKYPNVNLLLTLGSAGSLFSNSDSQFFQPTLKTEVVDTTAAGDTFTGYYIGAIAKGYQIPEALQMASAAASIAVSRLGAACSIPDVDEVIKRLGK